MSKPTHFLDLKDFSSAAMRDLLDLARKLRAAPTQPLLASKHIGAIFEKPSGRTEAALGRGVPDCGGNLTKLSGEITERPHHYAGMLSANFDAAVLRTVSHEKLKAIASHSKIPIINGLTDASHPCLVLADMLTIDNPAKKNIAFLGAATNVAKTYAQAAPLFDFELTLVMPESELSKIPVTGNVHVATHINDAVRRADIIVTDQWGTNQPDMFKQFQVNASLMSLAKRNAIFMHPMPLSADELEATLDVVDGAQSRVVEQTKNRTYAFAAALAYCLEK
jgi:ornithine carbamoyltransferase